MSNLTTACQTCVAAVDHVFHPGTGTRQVEVLAGDLTVTEQCFVRDEIRFLNSGRLIFAPRDREGKEYFDQYFVICRKITVIGGFKSGGGIVPCGPDDPGTEYKNNNVITWLDRLQSAATGAAIVAPASNGTSFGGWVDMGQGNNGHDGDRGDTGGTGNPGGPGKSAPRQLTIVAVEIEVQPLGHLNIDWDGQNGGDGGRGQNGGNGGKGMNGNNGRTDHSIWSGSSCGQDPGNGGNGGPGGDGGHGGPGGRGGNAGDIVIISTKANILTGDFANGNVSYRNDGGDSGRGGGSGTGGSGGLPGVPGFPTSACGNAFPGQLGVPGTPFPLPPPIDTDPNRGAIGGHGTPAALVFQEIETNTCADLLPLPMTFDPSGLQPAAYCRGFSTPATGDGSITGQDLLQATDVSSSLAGVTPSIVHLTSTDTKLDLHFAFAGNSALGAGNLIFKRAFGPDQTLNNALTVQRFEALAVAPTSGAKGSTVNVTITGHCFDPSAAFQQVLVSGLGVSVFNVLVVDDHTVQCVFDINALTASGPKDVTVKMGLATHTLLNAFTVT